MTYMSPDVLVAMVAKCFAERGVDVILDADGPTRHHSKRAHQDRVAEKDRIQIQLMEHRSSLAQLINHPNPTNEIIAQKKKLKSFIQKKEKQQRRGGLPTDFVDKIEDFVKSFRSTNGTSIVLQRSLWQADPAIAKRAIDGGIDGILSGDSDFAMYVGNGGPDGFGDIMLCHPKFLKNKAKLNTLEIWTGQSKVVDYINDILQPKVRASIFRDPKKPPPAYPIFDGLEQMRVRALFAVAIGCDALPGGIVGMGATKAFEIKSNLDFSGGPDAAVKKLLDTFAEASSKSKPQLRL